MSVYQYRSDTYIKGNELSRAQTERDEGWDHMVTLIVDSTGTPLKLRRTIKKIHTNVSKSHNVHTPTTCSGSQVMVQIDSEGVY